MNTNISIPPSSSPAFSFNTTTVCLSCTQCYSRYLGLILILFGFSPARLYAQETLTAGLMLEDSRVLGKGGLELSAAYTDRVLHGSYGLIVIPGEQYTERSLNFAAGVAYGLTDQIDLLSELQWNSEYLREGGTENHCGFAELRLGVKWEIWRMAEEWSLSWVPVFTAPISAMFRSDEDDGVPGLDQLLVLSGTARAFSSTIQAGMHYGYAVSPDPDLFLHFAAGVGYQFSSVVQPRLEMHFEYPPGFGSEHSAAALMGGVVLLPVEELRLDIGLSFLALGEQAWKDQTMLVRAVYAF